MSRRPPGQPPRRPARNGATGQANPSHPKRIAARRQHLEWLHLRAQGYGPSEIAARYGVSKGHVSGTITALLREVPAEDIETIRAIHNVQLNEAIRAARGVLVDPDSPPELRLKAIDRIERLTRRQAQVNGSDAPPQAPVDRHGNTVVPSFLVLPGPLPESVEDWVRDYGGQMAAPPTGDP